MTTWWKIACYPGDATDWKEQTFRFVRLVTILALAFLLLGCSTPTATKVEFQTVKVEVQKPCPVTKPVIPAKLTRPLPSDPARLIDLLTAKLLQWAGPGGYGERADAALDTCVSAIPR